MNFYLQRFFPTSFILNVLFLTAISVWVFGVTMRSAVRIVLGIALPHHLLSLHNLPEELRSFPRRTDRRPVSQQGANLS